MLKQIIELGDELLVELPLICSADSEGRDEGAVRHEGLLDAERGHAHDHARILHELLRSLPAG